MRLYSQTKSSISRIKSSKCKNFTKDNELKSTFKIITTQVDCQKATLKRSALSEHQHLNSDNSMPPRHHPIAFLEIKLPAYTIFIKNGIYPD